MDIKLKKIRSNFAVTLEYKDKTYLLRLGDTPAFDDYEKTDVYELSYEGPKYIAKFISSVTDLDIRDLVNDLPYNKTYKQLSPIFGKMLEDNLKAIKANASTTYGPYKNEAMNIFNI